MAAINSSRSTPSGTVAWLKQAMVGIAPWLKAPNTVLDDIMSLLFVYTILQMAMEGVYAQYPAVAILSGRRFWLAESTTGWADCNLVQLGFRLTPKFISEGDIPCRPASRGEISFTESRVFPRRWLLGDAFSGRTIASTQR